MLAQERCSKIITQLHECCSVTVKALSGHFNVSEETIRRDLEKVEKMNIGIRRTHGGAYLEIPDCDIPSHYRETLKLAEKTRIAEYCGTLINDGDSIMLDASTTALCVARQLLGMDLELSVITNSFLIMSAVKDCRHIHLIGISGSYYQKNSSFVGHLATDALSQLHATKAFISGMGVHSEFGITGREESESLIRKIMVENSGLTYLIADDTKFGRCFTNRIASLDSIDTIITNNELLREWKELLHIRSTDVRYV